MFSLRCALRATRNRICVRSYCISEDNPYFAKYAAKLKKYQDANPDEFESKIQDLKKNQRKKLLVNPDGTVEDGVSPKELKNAPRLTKAEIRVDDPEQLESLSVEQLSQAWKDRHANKDSICGIVPSDQFETMAKRGVEFPIFVYPVPRGDGYEMYLGQVSSGGSEVHFTPLVEFQKHQSEAPPCLQLKFFADFMDSKGIVLMAGEYNGKVIGPEHAQCLANQHQIYYGSAELKRKLLLWNFNREPKSFNHEVLIEEFEKTLGGVKEGVVLNQG